MQGIYVITNSVNGRVYIGSSVRISTRWRAHVNELRRGRHHCLHLQNAWNKYGSQAFVFSVIEAVVDVDTLVVREQFWLDMLRPSCYNVSTRTDRPPDCTGRKLSEGARAQMRAVQARPDVRARKSASLRGLRKSVEHRRKIAESHLGMKADDETRAKLRVAWIKRKTRPMPPAWNRGIRTPDVIRQKISDGLNRYGESRRLIMRVSELISSDGLTYSEGGGT